MDTRDALRQAKRTADELGLEGWRFVIDARPTRRLGQTRFSQRTIGLSRRFVVANDARLVDQTIRHEIAHALVGPGYGHGPVWRAMARKCGVVRPGPSERDPELRMAPSSIAIVCPRHGVIGGRARMPKAGARYRHNACGETVTFERA